MHTPFPEAVPEMPVTDLEAALEYYDNRLGFSVDWGHGGERRNRLVPAGIDAVEAS